MGGIVGSAWGVDRFVQSARAVQLPLALPPEEPLACSMRCGECVKRIREEALWARFVIAPRVPPHGPPKPRVERGPARGVVIDRDGEEVSREEWVRYNWEVLRARQGVGFRTGPVVRE